MTHHQLLTILSAVVGVNSALLFTFLNHQIRHGSSCLLCDDPPLYPGCSLRLVKWSFYDPRRFYQAYNALPHGDERILYWHFDLNCFTSAYPRPTVFYQPGLPTDVAPDVAPDVALTTLDTEPGFDSYSSELTMHVRGRAINHAPAYYPPMVALLAQHPVPVLFQLDRSFVRRYHNVDLQDLPVAFYRVLLYVSKQRAYEDDPSESLSIDLRQHHVHAYRFLTSLSYIEQYDLSQFRAFLTAFPASYPWDDTISFVDTSLLPLYQSPLQPVEGAQSPSPSQRIITRAECRLMETKGLQSPPYAWRGIKSQLSTDNDDMSSILIDSPTEISNDRQNSKPALLNANAA